MAATKTAPRRRQARVGGHGGTVHIVTEDARQMFHARLACTGEERAMIGANAGATIHELCVDCAEKFGDELTIVQEEAE